MHDKLLAHRIFANARMSIPTTMESTWPFRTNIQLIYARWSLSIAFDLWVSVQSGFCKYFKTHNSVLPLFWRLHDFFHPSWYLPVCLSVLMCTALSMKAQKRWLLACAFELIMASMLTSSPNCLEIGVERNFLIANLLKSCILLYRPLETEQNLP